MPDENDYQTSEQQSDFQKSLERAQMLREQETQRLVQIAAEQQQRQQEARQQQEESSKEKVEE